MREKRWQSKDKHQLAPNLSALANRFNEVSFWVSTQIVEAKKKEISGVNTIKYFINVMQASTSFFSKKENLFCSSCHKLFGLIFSSSIFSS